MRVLFAGFLLAAALGASPRIVVKLDASTGSSAFLDTINDTDELRSLTAWKPHTLTGDRKGTVSLSVTRNRRLTFRIDIAEQELCELNLEDYH